VQPPRPSANGSRAPDRVPARALVLDFHDGRHLGLVKAVGIGVPPGEASQAKERMGVHALLLDWLRRCQRVSSGEA
jgi:hypothetical protein